MKRKVNEGIRKTQCYEFQSFLVDNFYSIQKGRKRVADVVKEYLESIGQANDRNAFEQLLKFAKAKVIKLQQNSEEARFGGGNSGLWENKNKKVKISENELKNLIRESIEEIMTGGYITQGIEKQWGDPNSPLRQFGDEWLRLTLDLCKKHNSTIPPQKLVMLMQPIAVQIMMNQQ